MKILEKMPGNVKEFVTQFMDGKERILCHCEVDLDEEQGFSEGFLVLTDKQLFYIVCDTKEEVHMLGGCRREYSQPGEIQYSKRFDLKNIENLEVFPEVARHYLLLTETSGVEERVCFFSGSMRRSVYQLTKCFQKWKAGEEYKEEEEEDGLYCPKCGSLYADPERKLCPKCMDKKSVLFRMLGYLKPFMGKLVLMSICFLGIAILNMVWPYLSGTILYDQVLAQNPDFLAFIHIPGNRYVVLLIATVIAMFVSRLFRQVFMCIQGVMAAKIAPDLVYKMKTEIFESMGKLELHFFQSNQTGGLMTRILSDASRVSSLFIDGLPYFVIDTLTIVIIVVVMLCMNPILTLVILIILPLMTFGNMKMMPGLDHANTRQHQATRKMNSQVNDNLNGARVVKAFGREDQEEERFVKYNDRVKKATTDYAAYDNKFFVLYMACTQLTRLAVWTLGGFLIVSGSDLEVGVLITFVGYIALLEEPLDYFSHFFRWVSRSLNSAQRIFEIIDAVPKIKEKPDAIHPEHIEGDLELSHVTFGYEPGKSILKDITFHVKPGEVLGIVGKSGAGKTTLVSLISRLYDPDEGEIFLDGVNVKDLGFYELRRAIAMVSQETYIFAGTVSENIRYGNPDASDEEVLIASIQAGAHDFICKMPDGYDTIVGSRGRSLSGGERQRVSIARAILANPRILILDEATSAVDTETELIIQKSLETLTKGRTTLSIAHRLSTLRNADHLIVIDEGRVTEAGTHQELIEKKGTFFHLMELQTKALAMRGLE